MMVVLKIPIAGLCWIVWRAIKAQPEPATGDPTFDGGGGDDGPKPRPARPPRPRRGEHGEALPHPPARVRAVAGRSSSVR
jgi:hypothetical protein